MFGNIKAKNIDCEGALNNLGNSIKLYRILLVGFKSKYADAYDTLIALGQEHKYNDARILSHSLKGVCGSLGAMKLESISRGLEYSYSNNDDEYIGLLEELREEVQLVLCDINHILDCID